MLISVSNMLNSGRLEHQMILITKSKVILGMTLGAKTLEAWDALAAPNIIRHSMAATPKPQKNFHGEGRDRYLGKLLGKSRGVYSFDGRCSLKTLLHKAYCIAQHREMHITPGLRQRLWKNTLRNACPPSSQTCPSSSDTAIGLVVCSLHSCQ